MFRGVITREQWGAAPPNSYSGEQFFDEGIILHWEGPEMWGDLWAFAHDSCYEKVRGIQRYHMNNGYADIAYSDVVCPHGYAFQARSAIPMANGASGSTYINQHAPAICFLWGVNDDHVVEGNTDPWDTLNAIRNYGLAFKGLSTRVRGHREIVATSCPGDVISFIGGTINGAPAQPVNTDPQPTPPPEPTPPAEVPNQVIDYSWDRPDPNELAKVCKGVMRYVSHNTTGKNLTVDEYNALKSAGLLVGLVWQNSKDQATRGTAGGKQDAIDAEAMADALGYPADGIIYYAVDMFAKDSSVVTDYFLGIRYAAKRPVGFYGGDNPGLAIKFFGLCQSFWQAAATSWSDVYPNPEAVLVQKVGNPYIDKGWTIDINDIQGVWNVGTVVPPIPEPGPEPEPDPDPTPEPLFSEEEIVAIMSVIDQYVYREKKRDKIEQALREL